MCTVHEDQCALMTISHSVVLGMRNVSDKICREDQNTNFNFNNFFFRKSCRLSDNVGKFDRTRQAIDDNTTWRMHFACWMNKGERTPRELETATLLQLPRISARTSWTRGTGLCCAHRKLQRHSEKTKQLRSKESELADIPKSCCIARGCPVSCVWLFCVCVCVCVCSVGTEGRWIHQLCFCTVNWSSARLLWQGLPERSE